MKNLNSQFLQEELKRVSGWIKFSDQKTAFLSVYYSVIFGLVISQKDSILQNLSIYQNGSLYFYISVLFCVVVSFLIGIFFLFKSVFPRLKNSFTDESLFYFGYVATMKFIDYFEEVKKLTEDEAKKQIIEQIYTNSFIADQKMKNVEKSTISLFVLIGLVLVLLFIF